jgi:tetratricopeptide (TPR) repeat protein
MDAPSLFHVAMEAAHADAPAQAVFYYSALIDTFPHDPLIIPTLYNRGLQREALQDFQGAVADYRRIVQQAPHQSPEHTWLDAHFRLGVCLTRLHGGWAAVSVFDEALREDLDDDERLEVMVGRGIAMQDISADDAAEVAFGDALRFFESGRQHDIQSDRDLAAEAAYRLGMINTTRFDKVTLHFPKDALHRALEEKCRYLLDAQNDYLRAIHLGDAHTLAVAGWGIGSLYERLYDAIVDLEPPETMDAESLEIYRDEVRQRVAMLVKKAIMVYERALMAGRAAGTADGDWVTRLEKALERLRTIYLHGTSKG